MTSPATNADKNFLEGFGFSTSDQSPEKPSLKSSGFLSLLMTLKEILSSHSQESLADLGGIAKRIEAERPEDPKISEIFRRVKESVETGDVDPQLSGLVNEALAAKPVKKLDFSKS